MSSGNYDAACPKFAESQRLDPAAGALLNLAICYEKIGRTGSAYVSYKETVALAEKTGRTEWAKQASSKLAALEGRVSRLVIRVTPPQAGIEVRRDGERVADDQISSPVPIDPGKHVVEARAPGKKAWSREVEIRGEHDTATVTITLDDDVGALAPVQPAATPPSDATQRTIALLTGAVGVAAIGAGAFFGLRASSKHADAKPFCAPDESVCKQQGLDLINEAKSAATISTIAFSLGGAALIAGIVLYVTAPRESKYVGVHVAPTGVAVGGRF
jgi:hypothetical protein